MALPSLHTPPRLHIKGIKGDVFVKRLEDVTFNRTVENFMWDCLEREEHGMSKTFWIGQREYEQVKKRKLVSRIAEKETDRKVTAAGRLVTRSQHLYFLRLTSKGKRIVERWKISLALIGLFDEE